MKKYISRILRVPERSFFLFGPRGVGKTTWLRKILPDAVFFDLLDTSLYLELSQYPNRLEAMVGGLPEASWIVVDEIQKIPHLLDEVHRLMELHGWKFALSGSSARKLLRKGTNLLGGRALTLYLDTFCSKELGKGFNLDFSLQWGLLPYVQRDRSNAADILNAYVNTYIKEEIREEGIVRRLHPFLRFLGIAGLLNGQQVNGQNVAREAGVPRSTVDTYFSILSDTLLAHFLPAYRPSAKVREQSHPKFYWFDPGVARAAAGLLYDPVDRLWIGTALENLIYHELTVYNLVMGKNRSMYYYRTGSGAEIDFVIETRKAQLRSTPHVVCIELKLGARWDRHWERSIRSFKDSDRVKVDRMVGIYTGKRTYHFDGFDVFPVEVFLERLYRGDIF